MDLFDLAAKISLDSSEYEQGLEKASDKSGKFGDVLKKGIGVAVTTAAATVTAAAATVTGLAKSFVGATGELAAFGDQIDKNSQKMGVSSKFYQEWDAVLQHSGTSMDSMSATFKKLATASQDATDDQKAAFEQLGLSMEQVKTMSSEDLFTNVIKGLQGMEEGTERTALATTLLGKGAMEMGALLNTSAEDTQAMIDTVNKLGGVLSDDAVKDSARYQDSLQDLQTVINGTKNNITANFLPAMADIMDGLTKIFSGDSGGVKEVEKGIKRIANTIRSNMPVIKQVIGDLMPLLAQTITESIPILLDAAGMIITSLADGIIQNLPMIIDSAMSVINQLVVSLVDNLPLIISAALLIVMAIADGIIQNLPLLIDGALQIIVMLADYLVQNLPTLIPAIVDIVVEIVNTLIDNIDLLIDAAIAIIIALADGLIQALPRLIDKAPTIIEKLASAIIRNLPKILKAGVELIVKLVAGVISAYPKIINAALDIITNFVKGITNGLTKIKNSGKEMIDNVKSGIMEKIEEAKSWGMDLIDNFIGGIKEKWETLKSTLKDLAGTVKDFLGFSEPKLGPLSNFHTYAPDMMDLFAKGIKDNEKVVTDQIARSFDFSNSFSLPAVDVKASAKDVSMQRNSTENTAILRQLNEKLDNMKFYLSTGALVGALTPEIDRKLGQKMLRAERGVL